MAEFILWGATGQAKVLHEALLHSDDRVVVLVDNRALPPPLANIPLVLGLDGLRQWLMDHPGVYNAAAAIGGVRGGDRLDILAQLEGLGCALPSIRHAAAFVAKNAAVGPGSQILAHATVCAEVQIGRGVIINTAASIDHECIVRDGAHIAPGATLAGEITIGERAFVGTGAVILPRLTIGEDAVIGAGAVVTKDVEAGSVVAGVPARRTKAAGDA